MGQVVLWMRLRRQGTESLQSVWYVPREALSMMMVLVTTFTAAHNASPTAKMKINLVIIFFLFPTTDQALATQIQKVFRPLDR